MPAQDTLVKLLRTGRTHYDYTYTEGLNVCTQPWDDGHCTPGGLYACELRHLFDWISLYPDITPRGNPVPRRPLPATP
jgi:hypothetical protein